jgi:hypothetical protein
MKLQRSVICRHRNRNILLLFSVFLKWCSSGRLYILQNNCHKNFSNHSIDEIAVLHSDINVELVESIVVVIIQFNSIQFIYVLT